MNKEGQVSIEYLIVIGFVVFLIIGILSVSIFYSSSVRDRIRASQLESFAKKIVGSGESVYFSGTPSKVTITAYLPKGVNSISLQEQSIVFDYNIGSSTSVQAFSSDVPIINLQGQGQGGGLSVNEGLKKLEITALSGGVRISEI